MAMMTPTCDKNGAGIVFLGGRGCTAFNGGLLGKDSPSIRCYGVVESVRSLSGNNGSILYEGT